MDPEMLKDETNKHNTDLNQESFENTNVLFQTDSEFLEEWMDGKEINSAIQNESHRDLKMKP